MIFYNYLLFYFYSLNSALDKIMTNTFVLGIFLIAMNSCMQIYKIIQLPDELIYVVMISLQHKFETLVSPSLIFAMYLDDLLQNLYKLIQ